MKVSESVKKMCDVLSCIPPDFKQRKLFLQSSSLRSRN